MSVDPIETDKAHWRRRANLTSAAPPVLLVAASTFVSFSSSPAVWLAMAAALAFGLVWVAIGIVRTTLYLISRRWGMALRHAGRVVLITAVSFYAAGSGDVIRLVLQYPHLSSEIHARPNWQTEPVRIWWGPVAPSTAFDTQQTRTLVYDGTDASAANVARQRLLADGAGDFKRSTRHLIGHFYIETDTY